MSNKLNVLYRNARKFNIKTQKCNIIFDSISFRFVVGCNSSWYGVFRRGMVYFLVVWCISSWYGVFRRGMVYFVVVWWISSWYGGFSEKIKCRMHRTQTKIVRRLLNAPPGFHVLMNLRL